MTDGRVGMVGVDRLRVLLEGRRDEYANAQPYPHVVVDDVLPPDVIAAAVSEFPAIDDPDWVGYLHVNETKFANPRYERWGPTLRSIAESLCSDDVVKLLSDLTGFDHLVPDLTMDGGGLHQTLRGGHLNVHTDFTAHHFHHSWRRRINLLLYLNDTWAPEWGGALEMWDSDVQRCVQKVEPLGNRMLIFTTSAAAYHGHPEPLNCPLGQARRSLALYYFTEEHRPRWRSTTYRARPGDGRKAIAITADRYLLRVYDAAKRHLGFSDRFADKALRTANRFRGRSSRVR